MTFNRSLNEGALFGLGKGWTPLFIIASFLALGFVLYLFVHSKANQRSLHIGLALVLAGALGNLFDRSFMIADIVVCYQQGKKTTQSCKVVKRDERGIIIHHWPDDGPAGFIPQGSCLTDFVTELGHRIRFCLPCLLLEVLENWNREDI